MGHLKRDRFTVGQKNTLRVYPGVFFVGSYVVEDVGASAG